MVRCTQLDFEWQRVEWKPVGDELSLGHVALVARGCFVELVVNDLVGAVGEAEAVDC
jgi:hypothetical protein